MSALQQPRWGDVTPYKTVVPVDREGADDGCVYSMDDGSYRIVRHTMTRDGQLVRVLTDIYRVRKPRYKAERGPFRYRAGRRCRY